MKTLRSFDLRFGLPLLVGLIIAGLIGVWMLLEYRVQTGRLQQAYVGQWQRTLSYLHQDVERELREDNSANIEELLTRYNTDPRLQVLAVVDADDVILWSNRLAWKNRPASRLPGYDPQRARQIRGRDGHQVQLAPSHHVHGYLAVAALGATASLRGAPTGILYLDYNLAGIGNEVWANLWRDARFILLLAAGAMLLLVLLLYHFVTRPLQLLTTASHQLAGGEFDSIPVSGHGELARLAKSFNEMGRRLQENLHALHDREQRLSRTLEAIGDAVITTDASGRVTRLNPVAEQLTGWAEQDACGRRVEDVFPILSAGSRATVPNPVRQALQSGQVVELANDTTLLSRDGREYQIADSAAPIVDADGRIEGAILVFHDITEAYALREAQRVAAIAFDSHEAQLICNVRGEILRVNPAFTTLTGHPAADVIGKNPRLLKSGQHDSAFYRNLWSRLQHEGRWSGRIINHDRHGKELHCWETITAVRDDDGTISHYVATLTDLTELEQTTRALLESQSKYQGLLNALHDGMFLMQDGVIVDCNDKMLEMYGYQREEFIGQTPAAISPPQQPDGRDSRHAAAAIIQRVLDGEPQIFEWVCRHANGSPVFVEASLSLARVDDQPTLIGTVRDIRDRKQDEAERLHLIQELADKEQLLRLATRAAGVGIWEWDIRSNRVIWSDEVARLFGIEPDDFDGTLEAYQQFIHPEDSARVAATIRASLEEGLPYRIQHRVIWPDGSTWWLEGQGEVERAADGSALRMRGTVMDVTERVLAEAALRESENKFRDMAEKAMVGIYLVQDGKFRYANEHLAQMLEYPLADLIERMGPADVVHAEDLPMVEDNVQRRLRGEVAAIHYEFRGQTRSGRLIHVEAYGSRTLYQGRPAIIGTVLDITERKSAQQEIERLAYYDPLTGMANRRLLLDRLQQAHAHAVREQSSGALLYLDLDRFKILNDSLGHHAGDMLLQRVANRLSSLLREEDTVARLGGDEFVVMLPALAGEAQAAGQRAYRVAEKIRSTLSGSYDLDGHAFHISASIGIAIFPQDGTNAEELLHHADAAMYQAKNNGRDTAAFYHVSLQQKADQRLAIEEELRHAIQQEQLRLYYQPQVDAAGRILAAEALLRWQHPQRGLVMPDEFIRIAEESGLILEIGEWVLLNACQQLHAWQQLAGPAAPTISVNVSPIQFRHAGFSRQVEHIIQRCGIDAAHLTLEITEGTLIEELADTASKLDKLKRLGVRISIDDFGTGYSSLYYLKHLPLDELKIDRNYVLDIDEDPDDAVIVETILAMARHLQLEVVAEGVEQESQASFLRDQGCQLFQGYLFGRPAPVDEFEARFMKSGEA